MCFCCLGYSIGQVRLILQPYYSKTRGRPNGILPPPPEHLTYIQHFSYSHFTQCDNSSVPVPVVNPALNMYEVRHSNPRVGGIPKGDIIPLSSVWQPVQLIPKFSGPEADKSLTCNNILEKCAAFYVNSFCDNQIYQTVY
jgi:hypothetical protein